MFHDIMKDLRAVNANLLLAFLSNRGFHALLCYRILHFLWKKKISLLPLIITR